MAADTPTTALQFLKDSVLHSLSRSGLAPVLFFMLLQTAQTLFRQRLNRAITLPIALLLALSGISIWQITRLIVAMKWVDHTDRVIAQSHQIQKLLLDIETGERGYWLTNEEAFLDSYQAGMEQVETEMRRLQQLVSDNPQQSEQVATLANLQAEWLLDTAQLPRVQQLNEAERTAELWFRKQQMDTMRSKLATFIEVEEELRDTRSQAAQETSWWVIGTSIGSAVVVGGILISFVRSQLQEASNSYAMALETAQEQTEAAQRSAQRLAALHEIDQAILSAQSLENLSEAALDRLKQVVPYDRAAVMLLNAEVGEPQILAGEITDQTHRNLLAIAAMLQAEGLKHRHKPWYVADLSMLPQRPFFLERSLTEGYHSFLAAALFANGRFVGDLILLAHLPNAFNTSHQEVAVEVASQLAIAIQQTHLTTQLQSYAADLEQRVIQRTVELAQINERLTQLAAIVNSSNDAIFSTDLQGTILSWNAAAAKLFGYTSDEILGQPMQDLFPQDDLKDIIQVLEQVKNGDVQHYEATPHHKEGQPVDVSITVSPVSNADGAIVGISTISRNITERKRIEAQLRISSERISLANAELARAARLKDEFLAGMSHELRTPLNAILGLSEALLEEVFGELTEIQRDYLTTIEQSGKHLLELINDILDLSKIESGRMELDIAPTPVKSLCDSSLNFVKQQAHHKRIALRCYIAEELTLVQIDERRIRQVLVNLLSNAVKFTPEGGEVRLQVRADTFRETVTFSIIDTGIGIAPENLDKLFQPFVQLDSSLSRRYSGTGLGLALVRRIVELHGGSITLDSQLGQGSCFEINLPWQPTQGEPFAEPDLEAIAPQPQFGIQQALIVEDSETAANQMSRYLAELGVAAVVYPTGDGAVETIKQLHPDVIILDLLLPDQSGWEILAELKASPLTQSIPVVVVSVVDERSQALRLGAAEYLLKPISRQHLQQALGRAIATVEFPDQKALILASTQPFEVSSILLAEDNEANITTLKGYLQAQGFRVLLARNGLEAIQIAKQHQPELILMDIQMPEVDGLEATRRLRADPRTCNVPIVALTALAMPGDRERCLAAGATEYMTKPVSLRQLMHTITQYVPAAETKNLN